MATDMDPSTPENSSAIGSSGDRHEDVDDVLVRVADELPEMHLDRFTHHDVLLAHEGQGYNRLARLFESDCVA